jgi:hypothetical protein
MAQVVYASVRLDLRDADDLHRRSAADRLLRLKWMRYGYAARKGPD